MSPKNVEKIDSTGELSLLYETDLSCSDKSSTCSSRSSITDNEEEDELSDVEEEEDISEQEDDNLSDSSECIFIKFPMFPVNVIAMEKCNDTLDNLLKLFISVTR